MRSSTGCSRRWSQSCCVENDRNGIVARLSTFDTSMVVFSLVVGIGIFRTPARVAGAAGTTSMFFTAWVVGGLIALVGALTFAEIGARYSRAGGYYRVVAECYHPALAFMLNWCQTLMQGAGAAGVAFIGVEYLAPLVLPPAAPVSIAASFDRDRVASWVRERGVESWFHDAPLPLLRGSAQLYNDAEQYRLLAALVAKLLRGE